MTAERLSPGDPNSFSRPGTFAICQQVYLASAVNLFKLNMYTIMNFELMC